MLFENQSKDIEILIRDSFTFPCHLHNNAEILICIDGTFDITCNDQKALLKKGDIMLAFPGDIHSYNRTNYGKGIIIIFNPNISELLSSLIKNAQYKNFVSDKNVINLVENLLRYFKNNSNYIILYGFLHTILGMILKKTNESPKNIDACTFNSVINYISSNYTESISLKSVAKYAGVSQSHLSRLFSERIEGGFKNYLNLLRTEKAKELLINTDKSILEVMLESGFSHQTTFNRVFKKNTNLTPNEYRKTTRLHLH